MKKIIFVFILLSIAVIECYAQDKTGLVHYGEIQSMGMGGPVGPDYNAILVFNKSNSLFITRQDSLEGGHILKQGQFNGSGGTIYQTVVTNKPGFLFYKDKKTNTLYSRDIGFNYVKDTKINIHWNITNDTKTVGDYKVQKATAQFRGRNYVAWFSPEIPLPYGPWKLGGLPGLVLEAYDSNKEIYWYFKSIEYPTKHSELLKPIQSPKNQWMSYQDFKEKMIQKVISTQKSSRMAAENVNVSLTSSGDLKSEMLNNYIEAYSNSKMK